MREWINFYMNVDKKLDGSLTNVLLLFILPTIISILLLLFDVVIIRMFIYNIVPVSEFGWFGWSFNIVANYIIIMLGIFIAILAIGIVVALLRAIWDFFSKIYRSISRFFNIVKTAKQESFDISNIEMTPKKSKSNIKA